jgi:hypothetical protein
LVPPREESAVPPLPEPVCPVGAVGSDELAREEAAPGTSPLDRLDEALTRPTVLLPVAPATAAPTGGDA